VMDVPTANWFHKVDGMVGLVVYRHELDPPDDELVRDLKEIIGEARRFAKTVGDRYVGGFPITLETMVKFAQTHGKLDELVELATAAIKEES
jgi:hypothetical protein